MITDTTFFTNEPGYALLDRFKKTLKHIGSHFPESPLLKINKSLVREGKKLRYPKNLRVKMFRTIIEEIKKHKSGIDISLRRILENLGDALDKLDKTAGVNSKELWIATTGVFMGRFLICWLITLQ